MRAWERSSAGRTLRRMAPVFLAAALQVAAASEPAAPSPAKDTLLDLGWLAGSWHGEKGGVQMEEYWTAPAGGMMVGLHRDVRPQRPAFFEFLRIVDDADGIAYLAMPAGRTPPTRFPLKSIEARKVVFENPSHDFPQRILYWLDDEDVLHARIEGLQGGEQRSSEWLFRR